MSANDKDWEIEAIKLANTGVLSWRGIAKALKQPKSSVSDFLRGYYEFRGEGAYSEENLTINLGLQKYLPKKGEDNSRVLVISDMHVPYNHKNLVPFLQGIKDKYQPTRIICIGDELDYSNCSFHDSDPDLMSAGDELKASLKTIKNIEEIFPVMDLIDSNHGSMIWRKAKHHGIPRHFIKSYNDMIGVGSGWKWHNDLTIVLPDGKPVYFHHGKSANGLQLSQTMGMSCVQGHFHEKFNISYWANSLGLYFSMQIGCLIDDESYAFAYNNVNLKRPIIGLGLIIDGKPVLEAMPL